MASALEALDASQRSLHVGGLTAPVALKQLLTVPIQLRKDRLLQAAMRSSRMHAVEQLHDFDFSFQPSLRRSQIDTLNDLGFVDRRLRTLKSTRKEHASTVLSLHTDFEEWGEILVNTVMAATLMDRLVQHCNLDATRGNSYRMRQHTELWQSCARQEGVKA